MNADFEGSSVLSLRPIQAEDEALLVRVFASTREVEKQAVRWKIGEWEAFIKLQYRAQKSHYVSHFPTAAHDIILCDKEPAGRLWVHQAEDEIRLLDIALLPEHRSQGIGTHLIQGLQKEATRARVPLRHSVELENPRARKLYERLGFVAIKTRGLHTLMEWIPHER
jgi:ribosomal protein S18 acetylase RimI-like enzyme